MKAGFILLEILLASALAAIIGIALLGAFDQLNFSVISLDSTMTVHSDAALVMRQMERDLSGAFIPAQEQEEKKSEQQKAKTAKESAIDKVFYGTMRDGMVELLTCITNNPQQVYWSDTVGQAKPCVARVVYRLEPDKQDKNTKKPSYVLVRQESSELSFDAFSPQSTTPIRSYQLVRGIKSMKIQFYTAGEDGAPAQRVDTWGIDEEKSELPRAIQIQLELWHSGKKRHASYTYTVPIIATGFADETTDEASQKKEQPQQEQKKPAEPQEEQKVEPPIESVSSKKQRSVTTVQNILKGVPA